MGEEQYKETVTNAERESGEDQPRQVVSRLDQRLARSGGGYGKSEQDTSLEPNQRSIPCVRVGCCDMQPLGGFYSFRW
jgi:hypothetical protein